jgi:hypothetical protein
LPGGFQRKGLDEFFTFNGGRLGRQGISGGVHNGDSVFGVGTLAATAQKATQILADGAARKKARVGPLAARHAAPLGLGGGDLL